jgi:hypothetical protein
MQTAATGPDAGRRTDDDLVEYARRYLVERHAGRLKRCRFSRRHELEVDAMIDKQPQASMPRILDCQRPIRSCEHLEY